MAALSLRGCDEELVRILKETSERRGVSVNRLILETLRDAFIGKNKKKRRYDDLDRFAGTWSAEEVAEFEKNTALFEEIDEELWL